MAFLTSPGIAVKEFDISTYVPGVSTSVAAIGGVFSWGPVEDRVLISSEEELVAQFGRPTDDNYETFLIAANFLAYSNALYVSRAADANSYNAVANTGDVIHTQIKNISDFTVKQPSLTANAHFYAKAPGALGNSLKVSVCASADAYNSTVGVIDANTELVVTYSTNTTTVQLEVEDTAEGNTTLAQAELDAVLDKLIAGDYLTVSSNTVGTQYLKIASIGASEISNNTAIATITLANRYTLPEDVVTDKLVRNWEFFQVVNKSPSTTAYVEQRGGSGDEIHVVVVDEDGLFSGTPGTILEVWDSLSRATDSKTEAGTESFYGDVLNNSSRYVWAASDIGGITSTTSDLVTPINAPVSTLSFAGGTNSQSETAISLSALARAYDQFKSKEDVDVSIIIAGKAVGGTHGEAVANYIIDNIAEVRKDCVVTVSPQLSDVVNNPFGEEESLVEFRNALRSGSRGFLTSAYKYQFDRYNNKYRWVAGCGDDAGLMARTDFERDPWWSPAGQNRGVYKNVIRLAFNPDQAKRDVLYKNDVNPVITQVGSGTILYGDKTLLGKPSAFDRINVRRLFDTLEKAIEKASRDLLFEFNDEFTRARFRNMVEPYLRDVMGRRGITRFKVVCDETNNTPVVIDRNEFVGSILIVPAKSINFITLNFYAVANTISFEYLTGIAGA